MRRIVPFVLSTAWLSLSAGLLRADEARPIPLAERLGRLLQVLPDAQASAGACVVTVPQGQVVFEQAADAPFLPASNQKILAVAVALQVLGPDHQFRTTLARRGADLWLIGSGDPALGDPRLAEQYGRQPTEPFTTWAELMLSAGWAKVEGDVVIDDRAFDSQWVHPSWEQRDLPKWYAAPLGGLNFNNNCIEITLWPVSGGQPAAYEIFPPNEWIRIENRCRSSARNKPWIHRSVGDDVYSLRGECSERSTLQSVAVTDPGIFTGQVLRQVLQSHGIGVAGQVRRPRAASAPAGAAPDDDILAVWSTPISDVVQRALRDSQNLFAECLMKAMAWTTDPSTGGPAAGSWERGAQRVLETLRSWGVDVTGMVVADGSGLSRDNRVTARQLTGVLHHVAGRADIGPPFIDHMAVNGVEGTLRKRMQDMPGRVHGKTGYMSGVRTLSGYVDGAQGQRYAFAVLFNGIPGSTGPYNRIHDDFCRVLAAE